MPQLVRAKAPKNTNYLHLAADCTHKATYYYSCACGAKGDSLFEYGDVAPHKYINYRADGNATCSEDGTKTAKCENENCEVTDTIVIEDSTAYESHDFGDDNKCKRNKELNGFDCLATKE